MILYKPNKETATKTFYSNVKKFLVKPLPWKDWKSAEIPELWAEEPKVGLPYHFGYLNGDNRYPFSVIAGKAGVHMSVIGATGSGKSVLLNFIIHDMCHRNPPNLLELFLVDMKIAEFPKYVNNFKLPHAKVVAGTSDVNYVISMLQYFEKSMTERNIIMSKAGANKVEVYYERTGILLPTKVMIIDEFETMLIKSTSRQLAEIVRLIDLIGKLGRNTHHFIIFATQNLPSDVPKNVLGAFAIKVCLKVNNESIAEAAIGNSAPKYLPQQGFCYVNNTEYTEETNKKIRVPFINDKQFDDNLEYLYTQAKKQQLIEFDPEYYNEEDLKPWEDDWTEIVKKESDDFLLLGHKGTYIPNQWHTGFVWEDKPGNNMTIVSPKPIIRNNMLEALIRNFKEKQTPCFVLANSFSSLSKYEGLNIQRKELKNDLLNSLCLRDVLALLSLRKQTREIVNNILISGNTNPTLSEFAHICEMCRDKTDYKEPFITTDSDGLEIFSPEFKPFKESIYPNLGRFLSNPDKMKDIIFIIDGYDTMKGIGTSTSFNGLDWLIEAPQYGIKVILLGESIEPIRMYLNNSIKLVCFSNVSSTIATKINIEKAELIPESLGCLFNRELDTRNIFKLLPMEV